MSLRNALSYGVIALIWTVCARTNADAPVRSVADPRLDSPAAPSTQEKSGSVFRRVSLGSAPAESRPLLGRWTWRSPSEAKSSAGTPDAGPGPSTATATLEVGASSTPYLSELNQKLLQMRLQRIEKVRTSLLQRTAGAHAVQTAGHADPTPRPLIPSATGPAASQPPPTVTDAGPAGMSLNFPVPPAEPHARPANEPSHEIVIDVPAEDEPPQSKGSLLNRHRSPRTGS
jgi:hypothetical protein